MTTPNIGIPEVPEGTLDPAAGLNDALRVIDALLQTAVISISQTAPPGTPVDGDLYIVAGEGGTATGAWAGHDRDLARYVEEGAFWQFYTAGDQVKIVLNRGDFRIYAFDESASPGEWAVASGGGLTISDSNSPQFIGSDVAAMRFDGATLAQESDGTVVVTVGGGSANDGHGHLETLTISAGAITIDHSLGSNFQVTLNANVTTVNHTNLTSGQANWWTLKVLQDGVGGRTFAPPASWVYGSGVAAYTASSTAADFDLVQGVTFSNGTTHMVSYQKDFA